MEIKTIRLAGFENKYLIKLVPLLESHTGYRVNPATLTAYLQKDDNSVTILLCWHWRGDKATSYKIELTLEQFLKLRGELYETTT